MNILLENGFVRAVNLTGCIRAWSEDIDPKLLKYGSGLSRGFGSIQYGHYDVEMLGHHLTAVFIDYDQRINRTNRTGFQ